MYQKVMKVVRSPRLYLLDGNLLRRLSIALGLRARRIPSTKPKPKLPKRRPASAGSRLSVVRSPAQAPSISLLAAVEPNPPSASGASRVASSVLQKPGRRTAKKPASSERCTAVGTTWKINPSAPVAALFGRFGRGVVKSLLPYFEGERVLQITPRMPWRWTRDLLDSHPDISLYVWGRRPGARLTRYAEERGLRLSCIDEGFIACTLSGRVPSRLHSMRITPPDGLALSLEKQDFAAAPDLLSSSSSLIQVMREMRIARHNIVCLDRADELLGPRLRRRVLVCGEPGHRGPIDLAVMENPDAEIVYLTHPRDAGMPPMKHVRALQDGALPYPEIFRRVDHVYVAESTLGLEALMHGVRVTVTGNPFYAGWGLTDDRDPGVQRGRRLTLEELFCGIYLTHCRYEASPDPVTGCLAAMLTISAEREQARGKLLLTAAVAAAPETLFDTDHWVAAFRDRHRAELQAHLDKVGLDRLPLERGFGACLQDDYQCALAYLLAGRLREPALLDAFLLRLRGCVRLDVYEQLVVDLVRRDATPALVMHMAWCHERQGRAPLARQLLADLAAGECRPLADAVCPPPSAGHQDHYLMLAELELRMRDGIAARARFMQLLLHGMSHRRVFSGLAVLANRKFDFESAAALTCLSNQINPRSRNGSTYVRLAQYAALARKVAQAVDAMAMSALVNPSAIESFGGGYLESIRSAIGELPLIDALHAASTSAEQDPPLQRALRFITIEQPEAALDVLLKHVPTRAEKVRYYAMLAMTYCFLGQLSTAKGLLLDVLRVHPVGPIYNEAMRVVILSNDYEWGRQLLSEAEARGLQLGDAVRRKLHFGLGAIGEAFATFRDMKLARETMPVFGEKHVTTIHAVTDCPDTTVMMLAIYGPGDEIRFASHYGALRKRLSASRILIACDPRLYSLLARAFASIEFVPVRRLRGLADLADVSQFDKLPEPDLAKACDNHGWQMAQQARHVMLMTDALGDLIEDRGSFNGSAYLQPDPRRLEVWRERMSTLPPGPWIGLSWRSRLTSFARNAHYLSVEQLEPLFERTDYRFVNLQYDECADELAYLESRYPGRIVDFADLDQYNDFEGVAALMSCLDLVVAPATTVVELAGAIGRPTLLLSNSSELHWRKRPGGHVDIWYGSVTHVEGARLGAKESLVEALLAALDVHPALGASRRVLEPTC